MPRYLLKTAAAALLALCVAGVGGCALFFKDEPPPKEELAPEPEPDPHQDFLDLADRCAGGDLGILDEIMGIYDSSLKDRTFTYQSHQYTIAFERCMQKALFQGHKEAMRGFIRQDFLCAIVARHFYKNQDPTNGGYWLQRMINLDGAENAYTMAGKIFIQEKETVEIGVKMLSEAARMGNVEAQQLLTTLMQPSSMQYHKLLELKDE